MNNYLLWDKFKKDPTPQLKQQIILNYTNLVHYVIHHSKFISLNIVDDRDYFQFGIEGLSEAIDRFDPNYGTKFETYAIQRIRGKILDELRKIQIKPRTSNSDGEVSYANVSLNSSYDNEDGYMLSEVISNNDELPDEILNKNEAKDLLINAIQELEERDRLVLTLYYFENLNYKEIAEVLNITVSRVSQIHTKIIKDLKAKLKNRYE
ncbi:MAG TPA: sigma-70 family RNA polymerase sigma factor [Ignavibacteriales bacterium]|jgi:RNA polymerase sigma factor for flagellar operon FliA|nr:sigma-70 family RNA polymerase sigma factor [Ignavibacteriales bacterium]